MAYTDQIEQLVENLVETADRYVNRDDSDELLILWGRLIEKQAQIMEQCV